MKKYSLTFLVVCLFCILSVSQVMAANYKWKLGTGATEGETWSMHYKKFAESVEKLSNGKIKIDIYWSQQLGSEREIFEQAQQGLVDIAAGSFSNLSSITTVFEALQLPYLFESRDQYLRALSSPVLSAKFNEELEKKGLVLLFLTSAPARQLYSAKKKIVKPEDMAGMKWRISRSPMEEAMIKSFGANPISMGMMECLDGLRTGMVGGLSIPSVNAYPMKMWDSVKYIGMLNAEAMVFGGVMSKDLYDDLPAELKNVLSKARKQSTDFYSKFELDNVNELNRKSAQKGIEFYNLPYFSRIDFRARAMQTWRQFEKIAPADLIELILKEAGPVGDTTWGMEW